MTASSCISDSNISAEVKHLNSSLFRSFLFLCLLTTWIYCFYVVWQEHIVYTNFIPIAPQLVLYYIGYRLSDKHHIMSCLLLLLSISLLIYFISYIRLHDSILYFVVVVVLISVSILPIKISLATLCIICLISVYGNYINNVFYYKANAYVDILLLYVLTWLAGWLATRPLKTMIVFTLDGWIQAHKALVEARERRAELYRVLHALEEAICRIERSNNELVLARHEAEKAQKDKARLVAMVSHEIRSPLNLILGFSQLMALSPESYDNPLPPDYRADVYSVYRNSQYLLALVDDVLDLSQIEAQRLALSKESVDLETDVVREVVETVKPLAKRKDLSLRLTLAGNLPHLFADPARLRQVLLNLLINAVRLTTSGTVTISTAITAEGIVISVEDTGPGIAPMELSQLFKEFYQLDGNPNNQVKGSGLGLAISKHLVELHGGRIWAESKERIGTKVSFVLPLSESEGKTQLGKIRSTTSSATTAASGIPIGKEPMCIVCHTDPNVVRFLARGLKGYHLVGVSDACDIPRYVKRLRPKAIIVSPNQEPMIIDNGSQLPIKTPIIQCRLPAVTMSEEYKGIDSYITKPIRPETVKATMDILLQGKENVIVLLVDDEPDAVLLLERTLTGIPRPYKIAKAYSGNQALEIAQSLIPDLIFIDVMMPDMDGIELVKHIRSTTEMNKTRIVMVSGMDVIGEKSSFGSTLSVDIHTPMPRPVALACLQGILDGLSMDNVDCQSSE